MLFGWPIISLMIYRRLPIGSATVWSILGAMLILPVGTKVDLPMIPPMDKVTLPNLAALFICRFVLGKRIHWLPVHVLGKWLVLLYVASPFMTVLANQDPIFVGGRVLPGFTYYDALSITINQMLFVIPYWLGRQFLGSTSGLEEILRALAIAGLFYSLPMLFEVRMSPQLHNWIYGYYPGEGFLQNIRMGGFRPVVFLGHGLSVAGFTMNALVSAAILWRIHQPVRYISSGVATGYLSVVLLFCKSLGALIYGTALVALTRFSRPHRQTQIAVILVIFALLYPMLRTLDLIPVNQAVELVDHVSTERAQSLQFRLDNEEILLEKSRQRPFFGWGAWGRNRVYNEETGRDESITDGRWIIVMGQFGWAGFIAEFGLLSLTVLQCASALRRIDNRRDQIVLAGLTIMLGFSIIDMIPNGGLSPFSWLIAGALLGRAEALHRGIGTSSVMPVDDQIFKHRRPVDSYS